MSQSNELHTGWLSPTGEFFPCECCSHLSAACQILNDNSVARPDTELLSRGYVSIGIMTFLDHGFALGWKRHLTPEQIRFLKPYYEEQYGLPLIPMSKFDFEYEMSVS